jgi:hypothetical protein
MGKMCGDLDDEVGFWKFWAAEAQPESVHGSSYAPTATPIDICRIHQQQAAFGEAYFSEAQSSSTAARVTAMTATRTAGGYCLPDLNIMMAFAHFSNNFKHHQYSLVCSSLCALLYFEGAVTNIGCHARSGSFSLLQPPQLLRSGGTDPQQSSPTCMCVSTSFLG